MRFGPIPTREAEGAILAHGLHQDALLLRKGRRLSREDVNALTEAGIEEVVAAQFEACDVPEDEAAALLARVAAGAGTTVAEAFTGRVNLFADVAGVLVADRARIDALNAEHEAITIATLANFAVVHPGTMVATVKIIPFAAPKTALEACLAIATGEPLVRVAAFAPKRVRLIQTELGGTSVKMLDKTVRITADRVAAVGGTLVGESRSPHEVAPLEARIRAAAKTGFDILLIAGASAITDRRDVLPAAIEAAGGRTRHFGMPVDPGNLLLLSELDGRPVLGLPGCARSPKLNGFDWVLQRLAADLPVSGSDVMGMGVGGLLMEIPTRPQPRGEKIHEARAAERADPAKIAAIVLAAGQSRRMGGTNKLLLEVGGRPMAARAVAAALGAKVGKVVVVTGHEPERVAAALGELRTDRRLQLVHNPDYADGLSTSLRRGLAALGPEITGAVVCLGDMPRVTSGLIDRLIASFRPTDGRAIVVPTRGGKRGNPVLWGRAFWPEMAELKGDVGARHLIGANADAVQEIPVEDDASLVDIDTPEAYARLRAETAGPSARDEGAERLIAEAM